MTHNAKARAHVAQIAEWKPPPSQPCRVTRLRPVCARVSSIDRGARRTIISNLTRLSPL